jgi:hypothetical protein
MRERGAGRRMALVVTGWAGAGESDVRERGAG